MDSIEDKPQHTDPTAREPVIARGGRISWRLVVLGLFLIGSFASLMSQPVTGGDPCYHNFADQRKILGIPHFFDVISNLPFLFVGLAGLKLWHRERPAEAPRSWAVFFAGVAAVSIGSAYYHWAPDDSTLIWDRLPMTVGFMALSVAVLAESVGPRLDRILLVPALVLGASSVFYWHWFHDLRFYYWIQALPLIITPLVLMLFDHRYTRYKFMLAALGFYIGAKICESRDGEINSLTGSFFSGHTIKHLLAALACFAILVMLRTRVVVAFGRHDPSLRGD